jgi:hypothetical protein
MISINHVIVISLNSIEAAVGQDYQQLMVKPFKTKAMLFATHILS